MLELDRSILAYFGHSIGTIVTVFTVLALGFLVNKNFVPHTVSVVNPVCFLTHVVLHNNVLPSLANILPIRFKVNIVNRVTIKHKLGRHSTICGVHSGLHREANCS